MHARKIISNEDLMSMILIYDFRIIRIAEHSSNYLMRPFSKVETRRSCYTHPQLIDHLFIEKLNRPAFFYNKVAYVYLNRLIGSMHAKNSYQQRSEKYDTHL